MPREKDNEWYLSISGSVGAETVCSPMHRMRVSPVLKGGGSSSSGGRRRRRRPKTVAKHRSHNLCSRRRHRCLLLS